MFLLTRRQAHAALAGTGAALAYLAAAEIGSRKTVRVGGLMMLSSMAMAGLMASKSSVKSRSTEDRLNAHIAATAPAVNLVANGGTVGGGISVQGNINMNGNNVNNLAALQASGASISAPALSMSGNLNMNGNGINNLNSLAASGASISAPALSLSGNINMNGNGINNLASLAASGASIGTPALSVGGNVNMNGNGINNIGSLAASGASIATPALNVSGNINLNNNNLNNLGGMNASQPHRGDLGSQPFNGSGLDAVQARCDFINDSLVTAGIFS